MDITFNAIDWYWIAQDGRIYGSKKNAMVYPYDPGYLNFLSKHGQASPWPIDVSGAQTTASLQAVMTYYGVTLSFT